MKKTIGIDLGTTNSVVAIIENGDATILTNEEGTRTTPSVVAWNDQNEVLVGQVAKRQAVTNPQNTVFSIKRFMGSKHSDVADETKRVPFTITPNRNGDTGIQIKGKTLSPPEISAKILIKLKKAAEAHLGTAVTDAVITVPAYFNDAQRQATKDAGKIAGLNVARIVNEPTAAALAYGLDKDKEELIAVYDFGGGTFDISILEVGDGVVEVVSTNGDTHLGGDNIDQQLIEFLIQEFKKDQGIDVSNDTMVLQRLKEAAEKAKIELSSVGETDINLPFLTADATGPKHMNIKLSRAKFESMIDKFVEKTLAPCKKALADAQKNTSQIDQVILVGGSTRIPLVQKKVKDFFGKEPHKGVNPDEVVALGAAVQAGVLSGDVKDVVLLDVTPLSLGVETMGGIMTTMINRNTTIPAKQTEVYSTAADNQTSVEIHVLQGERQFAKDNRTLGRFHLEGIMPAPRGVPKIEVTFDIDANGIVNVSAKDQATGKQQQVTITASSGLDEKHIEQMIEDARRYEAEDKQKKDAVELKNKAEQLVYSTEKTIAENKEKLSEPMISEVNVALSELKSAIETGNSSNINAGIDKLTAASHQLAQQMYQQPGTQNHSQANSHQQPDPFPQGNYQQWGATGTDDGVIDADFKEN